MKKLLLLFLATTVFAQPRPGIPEGQTGVLDLRDPVFLSLLSTQAVVTPPPEPADAYVWYASESLTNTDNWHDNKAFLTNWTDSGDNGYDVSTIVDVSTMPQVVSNAVGGYPACNFGLSNQARFFTNNFDEVISAPTAFFLVCTYTNGLGINGYAFDSFTSTTNRVEFRWVPLFDWLLGAGINLTHDANSVVLDEWYYITAYINTNTTYSFIRTNGAFENTGAAGDNDFHGLTLGAGNNNLNGFAGHIAEFLIFENMQSNEIYAIEGYLSNKFGF